MADFWVNLLAATVGATSPLLLASLGEIISERAGVLNLGLEGLMLVGAFTGFVATVITGNPYVGLLVGTTAGTLLVLVHAFLTITLRADQVVSGIMLTLLGAGLTAFYGAEWTTRTIEGFQPVAIPVLSGVPVLGEVLFSNPVPDYLALLLVPVVWYFLFRTNIGLEINAVGEDPETADAAGVNVFFLRYLCVLLGGAFAGAAGAVFSLSFTQLWAPGMIAGRGWIAVALVIFAQWRPWRALLGAYFFGVIDAFVIRSQGLDLTSAFSFSSLVQDVVGVLLDPIILSTYPYVATILVLVYISTRGTIQELGAPTSLLKPYSRESE